MLGVRNVEDVVGESRLQSKRSGQGRNSNVENRRLALRRQVHVDYRNNHGIDFVRREPADFDFKVPQSFIRVVGKAGLDCVQNVLERQGALGLELVDEVFRRVMDEALREGHDGRFAQWLMRQTWTRGF